MIFNSSLIWPNNLHGIHYWIEIGEANFNPGSNNSNFRSFPLCWIGLFVSYPLNPAKDFGSLGGTKTSVFSN